MKAAGRVAITPRGLSVDGREEMFACGEVHSWRIDPNRWGAVLDAVASLGFRFISSYVPWAVHETEDGTFDFTVARDIESFIALAADRGLKVVIRIGPNAGAELEGSGWPRRILDDPACQARRSNGSPYLLATSTHHVFPPSYASEVVMREVGKWYDEVVTRLAPLQHPDGPIVACQIDNEMGFHFQSHTFALDYHPEALDQYRGFLEERHHKVQSLNDLYLTDYDRFDQVQAPVDGSDLPEVRRVEWAEWKEEHLRRSIALLADMARERGMDRVPLIHNDYPRTITPMDVGALEASGAVDIAAGDIYSTRHGGRYVCDLARHLAGSSRLPFMAELGAGWLALPWLLPMEVRPEDEEMVAFRALFGGLRGFNVYMLVERDRWYGSPIGSDGSLREARASLYRRLNVLLDELDWKSLQRHAPVLLLENRSEGRRVAARQTLGEVVPSFRQILPLDMRLGDPDDQDTAELHRWEAGLTRALLESGLDYNRASSSSLPDLERYEIVLMPSLSSMDTAVWRRLNDAARRGVRVAVGPRFPSLDERLQAHEFDLAGIDLLSAPEDAMAVLPSPVFRSNEANLDLHYLRGPGREVLCAANHSDAIMSAKVVFDGWARLEGKWQPETLEGEGSVDALLEPWKVQIWEVFR